MLDATPWYAALLVGAGLGVSQVPHCAAMCSPIASFVCARSRRTSGLSRYQLGRFFGYGLAGAAAGDFGAWLGDLSGGIWLQAVLSWLLAVALLYTVRGLLVSPVTSRAPLISLQHRAPSSTGNWKTRLVRLLPSEPLALGFASALLPCGALYAALLLAAGTASASRGAATMVGFAFVSGVVLWAVGWLGGRLSALRHPVGRRMLAAMLLVGVAVLSLRPLPGLLADGQATDASGLCHGGASADH
jgi:uncharacterized protein